MSKRTALWGALLTMLVVGLAGPGHTDIILDYRSGGSAGGGCEPAGNGINVRTGSGTCINRSVASSDGSVTVTNGDGVSGNVDVVVDSAVFSQYTSGTSDASGSCSVGTFHLRTDTDEWWQCTSTDTWTQATSGAAGDVTGVGDCSTGACLDGTSDGGTYVRLYDGDTHYGEFQVPDISANATYTFPVATGTVLTADSTATLTNKTIDANGTGNGISNIDVADLADGTDGNIITWDAAGAPAVVATGTATHVLTSNGAGAAPTFQAGGGGASSFDPTTTYQIYEEFMTGSLTAGEFGQTGVDYSLISSGIVSITSRVVQTTGNPGWAVMTSHATSDDSGATLNWSEEGDMTSNPGDLRDGTWNWETVVKTDAASVANTSIRFGWWNESAGSTDYTFTAGVLIRYDTDVDSTFMFVICNATNTCDDAADGANVSVEASTITPVADTRYRLRIRAAAAGVGGNPTIYFSVNDETEKTFCSSGCDDDLATWQTSVGMYPFIQFLTRAATNDIDLHVDYLFLKHEGLDRY